jgi:hypothetical protein
MSYSILTVPFYLKQNEGKFAIDEYFDFTSKEDSKNSAFLHYAEFSKAQIARALVSVFLRNISKDKYEELSQSQDFLYKNHSVFSQGSTFRDYKYLEHISDFLDTLNSKYEDGNNHKTDVIGDVAQRILNEDVKFSILDADSGLEEVSFKIDSIKIYFNRSTFSPQVGFGFVSITLKWEVDDAGEMIETLSKIKKTLRYYENRYEKGFDFYLNTNDLFLKHLKQKAYTIIEKNISNNEIYPQLTCTLKDSKIKIDGGAMDSQYEFFQWSETKLNLNWNILEDSILYPGQEVKFFELEGQNKLLRVESMVDLRTSFKPLRTDRKIELYEEFANSTKSLNEIFGLKFNTIVKQLFCSMLKQNVKQDNLDKYIYFGFQKDVKDKSEGKFEKGYIKPHFLHLSIKWKNTTNLNSELYANEIYNLLRIPDERNCIINDWTFTSNNPDPYISAYALNEGAFIIEGKESDSQAESNRKDLINKYYPAVLFALNQKYLFHYFQKEIGKIKVTDEGFDLESLKSMKAMMIKGEFYQVFTLISNYTEIDTFFQNLRAKFNIKELKEEYLDSINGLEKLASLEAEKKEKITRLGAEQKEKEEKSEIEKREKLRSERIDNAVILLTFAQVIAIYFAIVDDLKVLFLCLVTVVLILSFDALLNEKSILQRILNFIKKKTDI